MKPFARLDRGFRSYLKKLIASGRLKKRSGNVSLGIAEELLNYGFETLSGKQAKVFYDHVIDPLVIRNCKFCEEDIRWSEMYAALDNGGYCTDCAKAHQEVLKKKAAKKKETRKKKE